MALFMYMFILTMCILILASMGGMFSERTGIINIGINGMMIIGAISYLVVGHTLGKEPSALNQLWLIPIAGLFGGLYSLLHGFACIKLKADHTISGFAINMLAFGIALGLLYSFGGTSKSISFSVPELALSNMPSDFKNIVSFKLFLTIAIVIVLFVLLRFTKWGLRLRSIGENPQAADVAGINVNSYKWQGVFISGILSGIAGAFFAQNIKTAFNGEVAGLGYLALAIMIMGQWRIPWIVICSIFFSFLYSGSYNLPFLMASTFGQYAQLFYITPYVVTIIVMVVMSKRSAAPAAEGIPYDKSVR